MPPKFSLQTVLDVRHSKVESIEIELGQLLHEKQEKEDFLQTLITALDTLHSTLQERMYGEIDLFSINHLRANINQISEGIISVKHAIEDLAQQVESKRHQLVEAKKEEESLKILKNKEYERFLEGEKEKEKRFVDDVYISQGFRQKKTEVWL
jgi:flagellar export protein FliJ